MKRAKSAPSLRRKRSKSRQKLKRTRSAPKRISTSKKKRSKKRSSRKKLKSRLSMVPRSIPQLDWRSAHPDQYERIHGKQYVPDIYIPDENVKVIKKAQSRPLNLRPAIADPYQWHASMYGPPKISSSNVKVIKKAQSRPLNFRPAIADPYQWHASMYPRAIPSHVKLLKPGEGDHLDVARSVRVLKRRDGSKKRRRTKSRSKKSLK